MARQAAPPGDEGQPPQTTAGASPAGPEPGWEQPPASPFTAPGAGAHAAASGGYPPGSGVPAPAPALWRRGRVRLIAGIVAVLLVALGFVLQHVAASPGGSAARGSITLPGTLLGLSENTSPAARALDRAIVRHAAAEAYLLHVVAGVYGSPSGCWLVVEGGACGTCVHGSAADVLSYYRQGYPGARLFPPGPDGGILVCGPRPGQNAVFSCWWYDDKTQGDVLYSGGSASGLADAVAKTRQIRAAVEH